MESLGCALSPRQDQVCRINVLINQVGYLTHGAKRFVVESNLKALQPRFWLCDANRLGEDYQVYEGRLERTSGDFGDYYTGDFSKFERPGAYVLTVLPTEPDGPGYSSYHSHLSTIGDEVYDVLIEKGLACFALQRCAPARPGSPVPGLGDIVLAAIEDADRRLWTSQLIQSLFQYV